jgi:hypothetical protein
VIRLIALGWVLGLPFLVWAWKDISRVEPRSWVGLAGPGAWLTGLALGYALGGWGAIAVALAWRTSMTREALEPAWGMAPEAEPTLDLTTAEREPAEDADPERLHPV